MHGLDKSDWFTDFSQDSHVDFCLMAMNKVSSNGSHKDSEIEGGNVENYFKIHRDIFSLLCSRYCIYSHMDEVIPPPPFYI